MANYDAIIHLKPELNKLEINANYGHILQAPILKSRWRNGSYTWYKADTRRSRKWIKIQEAEIRVFVFCFQTNAAALGNSLAPSCPSRPQILHSGLWTGPFPIAAGIPALSLRAGSPRPHAGTRATRSLGWRAGTTQLCSSSARTLPAGQRTSGDAGTHRPHAGGGAAGPCARAGSAGTRAPGWDGQVLPRDYCREVPNSKVQWSLEWVQHVVPPKPPGRFWAHMGAKRLVCCMGSEARSQEEEVIK